MDRKKLEAMAWRHTHRDFRGVGDDGVRRVLRLDRSTGGVASCPLSSLTDAQLIDSLPRAVREALPKIPSKSE